MTDITAHTVAELRSGLEKKEFSSVDVCTAFIQQVKRKKILNAFISLDEEMVLGEARNADARRAKGNAADAPLLGIPIAMKDIISVAGTKTTCASKILENYIAPYDATVTVRLRAAGAIPFGKTNMDEFAMGSSNETSAFGAVLNPWDKTRVPGGSSGGSVAAVAARMAPAALGTDTGGSIRQPAALTNLVGIKPTYGRVSRYGVVAFASSLDQVGPIARTVQDAALLTKILSGLDPHDATSMNLAVPDFEQALGQSVSGLKIGIPKEFFVGGLAPEVEKAVQAAVKEFEKLGAKITEISLPHTTAGVSAYYIIAPAEASSNLARFDGVRFGQRAKGVKDLRDMYEKTRAEGFGAEVKRRIMIGTYVLSAGYYDAYYARAQKVRTLIANDFDNVFQTQCDVVLCPTSPTTAFKIGEKTSDPLAMYLNDVFTIPVNLAGLPGISIPCGFDAQRLPIGLQLIGRPFDEVTLFRAAAAYEKVTTWHTQVPPEP
jgi:aspartyl-tRNA(Asn)/glutamyl-tRNA(Gln) amidotransferase subunit A